MAGNKPQPPQALPQDKALEAEEPLNVETEAERMKRLERESELNKVPPDVPSNIGPDTTGVGQPLAQPVNQGQSLPATAVPVEKKFEGTAEQFYDPQEAERAATDSTVAKSGGKKANF